MSERAEGGRGTAAGEGERRRLRGALTEILGVVFAVGPAHGERLDEIATIAAVALTSDSESPENPANPSTPTHKPGNDLAPDHAPNPSSRP